VTTLDVEREQIARRSGAYSSALNAGGMVLDWLIERRVPGARRWPLVLSGAVGVALLALLGAARRVPRRRLGAAIFLLNAASVSFVLWRSNRHFASSGRRAIPFEANKLGAVTVALLAPRAWLGLTGIAAYTVTAVAQYLLFPQRVRAELSVAEPGATITYAAFATVLLGYRVRMVALERAMAENRARADAWHEFARTSLALHDLANTPLQTLELCLAIVRRDPGPPPALLERMDRAVRRLSALGQGLSRYETAADRPRGGAS
jgi:hypothetical protein